MKKLVAWSFIAVMLTCILSACGKTKASVSVAFVPHAYWLDSENCRLDLSFYHTGECFATTSGEIESCSIGNSAGTEFDCDVLALELVEQPLYTVGQSRYYMGSLTIKPKAMNASIGDAEIFITRKDGRSYHFPIGNIAFTAWNEEETAKANNFVYAYVRRSPLYPGENGKTTAPVLVVDLEASRDITLTRLASASDKFGFDLQNCKVCSYDEYAKTFEELVDNGQLDSKLPDIYRRKQVEKGEVTGAIELKAGEYVLLVPLVQYEKEIPEPIFSGIDIGFTAENESYLLHVNCNPLFSNNYHLEDEVTALFDKEQN